MRDRRYKTTVSDEHGCAPSDICFQPWRLPANVKVNNWAKADRPLLRSAIALSNGGKWAGAVVRHNRREWRARPRRGHSPMSQTRSTNGLDQVASAQHPEYCSCPAHKPVVGGNPGFGKGQCSTRLGRLGGDLEPVSLIDAADEVH